jgi:UPF0716 family protein affecting phage T7 exclusion
MSGKDEDGRIVIHSHLIFRFQRRRSTLTEAVERGDVEKVKVLLTRGADPNERQTHTVRRSCLIPFETTWDAPGFAKTVLMVAAESGNVKIVQLLLDNGADVNVVTSTGWTALVGAIEEDHPETAILLINRGADVNAVDLQADTPLILSAAMSENEVVKLLLERGADINAKNEDGGSPLMYAAANNHPDVVRTLLAAGAELNLRDNEGATALGWAVEDGFEETAQLLREAGGEEIRPPKEDEQPVEEAIPSTAEGTPPSGKRKFNTWMVLLFILPFAEVGLTVLLTRRFGAAITFALFAVPAVIGLIIQRTRYKTIIDLHKKLAEKSKGLSPEEQKTQWQDYSVMYDFSLIMNYWLAVVLLLVPGLISHAVAFYLILSGKPFLLRED